MNLSLHLHILSVTIFSYFLHFSFNDINIASSQHHSDVIIALPLHHHALDTCSWSFVLCPSSHWLDLRLEFMDLNFLKLNHNKIPSYSNTKGNSHCPTFLPLVPQTLNTFQKQTQHHHLTFKYSLKTHQYTQNP